jgi:hypothetical protein
MLLLSWQESKDVRIDSGIRHRSHCDNCKMRLLLRHIHISTCCVVVVTVLTPMHIQDSMRAGGRTGGWMDGWMERWIDG